MRWRNAGENLASCKGTEERVLDGRTDRSGQVVPVQRLHILDLERIEVQVV